MRRGPRITIESLSHLECPVCSYRLLVSEESEPDAWPLEARCSECGRRHWTRDLVRLGTPPAWFLEKTGGTRGVMVRLVATLVMACLPWWFWQRIRPSQPIRGGLLALLLVAVAALLYVEVGLATAGTALAHGSLDTADRGALVAGVAIVTVAPWLSEEQVFALDAAFPKRLSVVDPAAPGKLSASGWMRGAPRSQLEEVLTKLRWGVSLAALIWFVMPIGVGVGAITVAQRLPARQVIRGVVYGASCFALSVALVLLMDCMWAQYLGMMASERFRHFSSMTLACKWAILAVFPGVPLLWWWFCLRRGCRVSARRACVIVLAASLVTTAAATGAVWRLGDARSVMRYLPFWH